MNMKQGIGSKGGSGVVPRVSRTPDLTDERELSEQESAEAFKIIVTLREAIEAADCADQRIEGTTDRRYASFLTKARDRHLRIAETARGLLIDMIVTMSSDRELPHGGLTFAKRSS